MLEANPNLGYRDVQEILAYSAREISSTGNDWRYNGATNWNGGGLHYDAVNHNLGYGLVDALAAVRLAETWTSTAHVASNRTQLATTHTVAKVIPDGGGINAASSAFDSISVSQAIDVERVEVTLNVTHPFVGDLSVLLTSPSGTTSFLLWRPQQNALSAYGTNQDNIHFTFDTVLDWGESSVGSWGLTILDYVTGDIGTFDSWTLNLIGKPASADDTYIYTNEFSEAAADQSARSILTDSGGTDTLNASAVTGNLVLNLGSGGVSTIDGRSLMIASGTVIENAYGGDGNDVIHGSSVANILYGMRGNDTLDGSTGADTLFGDVGDDVYWVDEIGDVVSEDANSGSDTVSSWISYILPANVEGLFLQGSSAINAVGNLLDNLISGNDLANNIDGGAGNDILYGGSGNDVFDWDATLRAGDDSMYGGSGNDSYVISGNDKIIELAGEGVDTIWTSQSFSLADLLYVENLYLFGTVAANLTGNVGANALKGNLANNLIEGKTGNDSIDGGAGVDTAVFSQSYDKYTLTSISSGWVISGPDGSDTLTAMEFARFSDQTLALANFLPTGGVTIAGTATRGQVLTAANNLADLDAIPSSGVGAISYQWRAGGVNIANATSSTLALADAQVGKVITVVASYTDGHGTVESVSSAATVAVLNVNDAPTGAVTMTGTTTQGQTLTAANTLADADGLGTITYQWQAGGVNIANATNSTLVLAEAQVGKAIMVVASYTDGHGTAETVSSIASTAVANVNDAPTGAVTMAGTITQGQTLTVANTLADADGLGTLSYQWRAGGVNIANATNSTLVLAEAQVGKAITVVASYTDLQGTAESVTSTASIAVVNVNDNPTGTLTITGTIAQGQTLTAANTLADADSLGTLSYQWRAGGVNIANATNSTLVLAEAQVGKVISVSASYTDGHGTAESVASAGSIAVANVNDAPTGLVTITGTATQGQTLTAANNLADADGLGAISYQWTAGGVNIANATSSTLVLTEAQVGKLITVVASYTDLHVAYESVASMPTALVADISMSSPSELASLTAEQLNTMSTAIWVRLNSAQIAALTTAQLPALTGARLNALTTAQFKVLTTNQVAALTAAQVSGLERADFAVLSASQVGALTPAAVAALTTAQIAAVSTAQLVGLKIGQIAALTVPQLKALTTSGLNALTTAQFKALTPSQIAGLTTAQVAGLESADFAVLSAAQVGAFTPAAVAALTTAQIAAASTVQVVALTSAQIAALTALQLNALSTARLNALTTAQFKALTTAQIAALTTAQVIALESADFAVLNAAQIAAFTPADVAALTTKQIGGLTSTQSAALTSPQIAALSVTQLSALSSANWVSLNAGQVAAISTLQLPALTTARMNALTTAHFTALTTAQIAALTTAQVVALESADFVVLSAAQIGAFTTADMAALKTAQVAALSSAQLAGLTSVQIAAISVVQLNALSSKNWVSLNAAQVAALATAQLPAMTTARLNALTTAQFTALTANQITALTTAQVVALESADFAVLSAAQIGAFATDDLAALKTAQVAALSSAQLAGLSSVQITAISVVQLNALTSKNWVSLNAVQVGAMTTQQLAALTTARLNALTTAQFTALTSSQIAALTTAQVAKLETADLAALGTTQIRAFTTAEIKALTTKQISSLSTTQLFALTTAQVSALTTAQSKIVKTKTGGLVTPLMLDLDGNGVQTLGLDAGVQFDVANQGQAASTGWVSPTDGLLVLDRNHNEVIDDGGELFGSGTLLADGSHASDGFAALATLDANGDGVIDAVDANFKSLAVWVDVNSDGQTQAGELKALDALGISALHLAATETLSLDNGNLIGLTSSYDTADGASHELADVWLATAPATLKGRVSGLTQALGRFNEDLKEQPGISHPVLKLPANAQGTSSALLQENQVCNIAEQLSAFMVRNSTLPGTPTVLAAVPPAASLWHSDPTATPAGLFGKAMDPQSGHRLGR